MVVVVGYKWTTEPEMKVLDHNINHVMFTLNKIKYERLEQPILSCSRLGFFRYLFYRYETLAQIIKRDNVAQSLNINLLFFSSFMLLRLQS